MTTTSFPFLFWEGQKATCNNMQASLTFENVITDPFQKMNKSTL